MIQKMKKLTFLVYHKEYEEFLEELQKLGVVHLQNADDQSAGDERNAALYSEVNKLEEELKHVAAIKKEMADLKGIDIDTVVAGNADAAAEAIALYEQIKDKISAASQNAQRYEHDADVLRPWGQFGREQIEKLEANNIHIHFHAAPNSVFKKQYEAYTSGAISQDKSYVYFVSFTQNDDADEVDLDDIQLPDISLSEAEEQLSLTLKEAESLKTQLLESADALPHVVAYENSLINKIEFEKAQIDTALAANGKVMVVEGWFPVNLEAKVESFLKKADTYYDIREPQSEDDVPIMLKNNKFTSLFEGLTKMYGFPSYNEWDPTPIIAPFFTLFFAICMGDAGYGILIALYGLFGIAGKTKKVPILGEMLAGNEATVFVLGVATTIVGFFLGTFFGINIVEAGWIPATTALGGILAWLQGNVPGTGYSIQMAGAICIGVFHICLAMIIKALLYTQKEGFKSQISTWGWVILLVGSVITGVLTLAGTLSQDQMQLVLIGIGAVAAVAIYLLNDVGRMTNSPIKGIIINPLAGLYDTYNMASGLMGDILSYIRIYALCLAGGMLGGAFNMIGDMVRGDEMSWTIVFAVIIYVIGHIFNLLMSAISAFVHPLRLNFVEYFKNAGYEGRGTGYKPFEVK